MITGPSPCKHIGHTCHPILQCGCSGWLPVLRRPHFLVAPPPGASSPVWDGGHTMVVILLVIVMGAVVMAAQDTHYPPGAPRITVGPYQPWGSPGSPYPGPHTVPHGISKPLPSSHPGYQTDIVIDPYAQVRDKK